MGILSITLLGGTAEVFGRSAPFNWSEEGGLSIGGLSLADAQQALGCLSRGGLSVAVPVTSQVKVAIPVPTPTTEVAPGPASRPTETGLPAISLSPPAPTPSPTPEIAPSRAQALESPAAVEPRKTTQESQVQTAPSLRVVSDDGEKVSVRANGYDLTVMEGLSNLGDVLVYLSEHGVVGVEAHVAECTKLRADLPLLSKIDAAGFAKRVKNAYNIRGLGETGAP